LSEFPSEEVCVAYLYCDYRDSEQTPVNMVGALLKRVVSLPDLSDGVFDTLHKTWRSGQVGSLKLDEASQLFMQAVEKFHRIYICVDALDECLDDIEGPS
jgi:hypothetical protein